MRTELDLDSRAVTLPLRLRFRVGGGGGSRAVLLATSLALVVGSCRDEPVAPPEPDGIPATLEAAGSDLPEGVVAEYLSPLPRVRVLDRSGTPVPGVQVDFSVLSGGGRLVGDSTGTTDGEGLAAPGAWILGAPEGEQRLRASVQGPLSPVELAVRGVRPVSHVVNGNFLLGEGEYESGDGPPGWTTVLLGAHRRWVWDAEGLVLSGLTGEFNQSRLEQCVPLTGGEDLMVQARVTTPNSDPLMMVRLRGEFYASLEGCQAGEGGDRLIAGAISTDFPLSPGTAVSGAWELASPVRWAVTRPNGARAIRVGLEARDRTGGDGPGPETRVLRVERIQLVAPQPGEGPVASVEVLTGGRQWARPGDELSVPVRVQILDEEGLPLPGQSVEFRPSGSGTVMSPQAETDSAGVAETGSWRLGMEAGLQSLEVRVEGVDPLLVDAYAVPLPAAGTLANGDFVLNSGRFSGGGGPAGWMLEVEETGSEAGAGELEGVVEPLDWSQAGGVAFNFPHPTGGFGDRRLDQCFPVDPLRGFRPVIQVGSRTPHGAAGLRINLEFYPDEATCIRDRSADRITDPITGGSLQVRSDHFPWPASGVGPREWARVEGEGVFAGALPPEVAFARLSIRVRDRSGPSDGPSTPPVVIQLDEVALEPRLAPPPGPPSLSHPGGFYPAPLLLEATPPAGDVVLRYTLDGSEPTEDSPLWEGPMFLGDRNADEPVISRIPTAGPGISQVPTWQQPLAVKLGHAIRIRAFRAGAEPGPVVSASYIVGPPGRSRYPVPVLSLVMDPDDLFDDVRGIYVPGVDFRPGDSQSGNYHGRGRGWERAAHLDFFETDGSTAISHGVGIRIHGGHSRNLAQKSLRIYAREEYGAAELRHRIFPDRPDPAYGRILLRNSGNDWVSTVFRDGMLHSLVEHLAFESQAYRPAVVFLNGEFWGIHNLRERYDDRYFQRVYGFGEEWLEKLELDPVTREFVPEPGTPDAWEELVMTARNLDPGDPDWWGEISARVDMESLLDYLAVQLYVANTDWPHNNIEVWRARTAWPAGEEVHPMDGRFRWILKDLDFSFGRPTLFVPPADADFDSMEWLLREDWSTEFFRQMMAHPGFRDRLLNRIADLSNATFLPERVIPLIDSHQEAIRPVMAEHLARWRYPAGSWDEEVQKLRWFAQGRAAYLRDLHLVDRFQLGGTALLTVDRSGGGGTVKVNSLVLNGATPGVPASGPWTGTYFLGVPVELQALPQPGFRFDGWEFEGGGELSATETEALESGAGPLTLRGDLTLRARFVPGG